MFNKFLLVRQVAEMLRKKDFDVFVTNGCFDIAARREYLLLLKVLFNVDCISQETAYSLRSLAYFLSAYPLIVALRSTRFRLQDNIVYSRFFTSVVTPKLLESIIDNNFPSVKAAKGRHTVEIDTELLRKKRLENNYTLEQLAKKIGISKKALYEIEHKRVNPTIGHVEKMEEVLNTKLRINVRLECPEPAYLEPKDSFEKKVAAQFNRMKIENSPVRSTIFKIVGREKRSFITGLYQDEEKILESLQHFKKMTEVTSAKSLFIVREGKKYLKDLPIILESDLERMDKRDFIKVIESSAL